MRDELTAERELQVALGLRKPPKPPTPSQTKTYLVTETREEVWACTIEAASKAEALEKYHNGDFTFLDRGLAGDGVVKASLYHED